MNRIELIQEVFKNTNFENYLEIGCHKGLSFLPVKAKYKFGVDPSFKISTTQKLKWILKVPSNINNKYFEETSDDFFLKREEELKKIKQLDVVLVDGLHTYRASLQDVLNSLKYLNTKGMIIMHDCYPPFKAAALPTDNYPSLEEQKGVQGWTGQWCGDVWKTIVYLRKSMPQLVDACVIDTDYGLGYVRPKGKIDGNKLIIDEKLYAEIDQLTYDDLARDPQLMINIKSADYTETIIKDMGKLNK